MPRWIYAVVTSGSFCLGSTKLFLIVEEVAFSDFSISNHKAVTGVMLVSKDLTNLVMCYYLHDFGSSPAGATRVLLVTAFPLCYEPNYYA